MPEIPENHRPLSKYTGAPPCCRGLLELKKGEAAKHLQRTRNTLNKHLLRGQ